MGVPSTYPVIDLARTGSHIERCRREAGLTVRELQAYFGFEYPQAIYKWQHGACLPTVDNLLALARLLQVPMEDLLVYDDREVLCIVHVIHVGQQARLARPLCSRLRTSTDDRLWFLTSVEWRRLGRLQTAGCSTRGADRIRCAAADV